MKFSYKNYDFELSLMDEPNKNETFGTIAIFRVHYIKWDENDNKIEVLPNENFEIEEYEYINYFCDQENDDDNLKYAKEYIEDYLQEQNREKRILENALSIINDYYMIDKDYFEIDRRKEIEQNIKDLEKMIDRK